MIEKIKHIVIKQNSGFTLVEALVTAAVIMALSGISGWLLIGLTTVASDSSQRLQQYTSAELVTGFLRPRLSITESENLGQKINQRVDISAFSLTTEPGILPPSWAGDQLMFTQGGRCYRALHIKRLRQLWMAEGDQCQQLVNSQGLIRGPNQQINNQWQFPASSPVYDPVLDPLLSAQPPAAGVRTFLLAEGLAAGSAALFSYRDVTDSPITVDAEAQLGSSNPLYRGDLGLAAAKNIFVINLEMNLLGNPTRAADDQRLSTRIVNSAIYPNQLCLQGAG